MRKETAVQVDSAEGKDIKLSSDKKSEQIIMDILEESNLPILSEEYGLKGKTGTEYRLIIQICSITLFSIKEFIYHKTIDNTKHRSIFSPKCDRNTCHLAKSLIIVYFAFL